MTHPEPIALYVHWPWCRSKCPYCDFNSHAADLADIDHKRWAAAYVRELEHFAHETNGENGKKPLSSIFFGGGTPSLMDPRTVETIISTAADLWAMAPDIEITLEANPTSVEASSFQAFHGAGINRVSVGVQALDDSALKFLGREHSHQEALKALEIAAGIFSRWNFDLIYARPDQTAKAWTAELQEALALGSDHLSLYQLGIEPGTDFFRNGVSAADEDSAADLFELTQEITEAAGMNAYEISNHARVGHESLHNLTYWTGGQYIGIGPGAHARLGTAPARIGPARTARHQIANPAKWLERVEQNGHATAKVIELSSSEQVTERVLSALRTRAGISRAGMQADFGETLETLLSENAIGDLLALDLIELDDAGLRTTAGGRLKLNTIVEKLLG